jgi:hypothetical protein
MSTFQHNGHSFTLQLASINNGKYCQGKIKQVDLPLGKVPVWRSRIHPMTNSAQALQEVLSTLLAESF